MKKDELISREIKYIRELSVSKNKELCNDFGGELTSKELGKLISFLGMKNNKNKVIRDIIYVKYNTIENEKREAMRVFKIQEEEEKEKKLQLEIECLCNAFKSKFNRKLEIALKGKKINEIKRMIKLIEKEKYIEITDKNNKILRVIKVNEFTIEYDKEEMEIIIDGTTGGKGIKFKKIKEKKTRKNITIERDTKEYLEIIKKWEVEGLENDSKIIRKAIELFFNYEIGII